MTEQPYLVRVAPSARRDLHRLPERNAAACVEFILGPLVWDPHRMGKPLLGPLGQFHAARRGPYRVIYRIDEAAHTVEVVRVDHRADVRRSP